MFVTGAHLLVHSLGITSVCRGANWTSSRSIASADKRSAKAIDNRGIVLRLILRGRLSEKMGGLRRRLESEHGEERSLVQWKGMIRFNH